MDSIIMLKKPGGIIFDMGDTILTQVSNDPDTGIKHLLEITGQSCNLDELNQVRQELNEKIWPACNKTGLEASIQTYIRLIFDRMNLKIDTSPQHLELEYWKSCVVMEPEPGIHNILCKLAEMNIPTGVLSNTCFSRMTLEYELQKHELLKPFRFVMASSEYGIRKPDRNIMLAAAQKLGIPPSDIWFVGDYLEYDVAGAKSAGMTGVWYHTLERPTEGSEPDLEVNSWSEFLEEIYKIQ